MLLERVDPFFAEFDRLTQRAFGATDGVGLPMDVVRCDDELIVTADLPGVPNDAITVHLENRVLTISAERRRNYADGQSVLMQERFDGAVSRRLRLPEWVDSDNARADHQNGVLTIRLPLADRAKPRRITVSAARADSPAHETPVLGSDATA